MGKKMRTEAIDYLFEAILSLENKDECYTFFEGDQRWKYLKKILVNPI